MSTSISNSSIHNNMENQDIIFIQRHHHYFLVGQSTALPPVFIPVSLQREDVSTASQALPIINEDGDPRPEPGPANQTSPDQADRAPTKPAVTNSDKLHQSDSVTDAGDSDDMAVTNQMTKSPAAHTVNTVTTTQDNATLAGTVTQRIFHFYQRH